MGGKWEELKAERRSSRQKETETAKQRQTERIVQTVIYIYIDRCISI